MMPATRKGSGTRETNAEAFRIDRASRVEHPNLSKNNGPSLGIVRALCKDPSDLISSHLFSQSGKCLKRARFTALLSGREPTTTITGALHSFWTFQGSIRLNPPKVTPDSNTGMWWDPVSRSLAVLVPSSPSTVIQSVLK